MLNLNASPLPDCAPGVRGAVNDSEQQLSYAKKAFGRIELGDLGAGAEIAYGSVFSGVGRIGFEKPGFFLDAVGASYEVFAGAGIFRSTLAIGDNNNPIELRGGVSDGALRVGAFSSNAYDLVDSTARVFQFRNGLTTSVLEVGIDGSLLPPSGGTPNVGTSPLPFSSGFFSGGLTAGALHTAQLVDGGTGSATLGLDLVGFTSDAGAQTGVKIRAMGAGMGLGVPGSKVLELVNGFTTVAYFGNTAATAFNLTGNATLSGTISASNFSGTHSGTNTGDVSLAAIGSSANANGASLSGQVLTLQPASASFGGVLTSGAQSIAGAKTLTGLLTASAGLAVAGRSTLTGAATDGVSEALPILYLPTTAGNQFDAIKIGGDVGDPSTNWGFTLGIYGSAPLIRSRAGGISLDLQSSGSLYPATNNANTLGTSGNRWANTYSVLGNFSGTITGVAADFSDDVAIAAGKYFRVGGLSGDNVLGGNGTSAVYVGTPNARNLNIYAGSGTPRVVIDSTTGNADFTGNVSTAGRLVSTVATNNEALRMTAGAYATFDGGTGGTFMWQSASGILSMGFGLGSGVRTDFTGTYLSPVNNNVKQLGLTGSRWSKTWSVDGDFSGTLVGATVGTTNTSTNPAALYVPTGGYFSFSGVDATVGMSFRASGTTQFNIAQAGGNWLAFDQGTNSIWPSNDNAVDLGIDFGGGTVRYFKRGYFGTSVLTPLVTTVGATTLSLVSSVAAAGVGFSFNTTVTQGDFDKLFSVKNNGTEKAWILGNGNFASVGGRYTTHSSDQTVPLTLFSYRTAASADASNPCIVLSASEGGSYAADDAILSVTTSLGGTEILRLSANGALNLKAGSAATDVTAGGVLNSQYANAGNVGTGEDALHTYTLPANTLTTTGRGVTMHASGIVATNVNAKTLKFYFGSQVLSASIPISVGGNWFCDMTVIRTGSSAQRYNIELRVYNGATNAVSGVFSAAGDLTETEGNTIVIKTTGEAVSNDDLVQKVSLVEFI